MSLSGVTKPCGEGQAQVNIACGSSSGESDALDVMPADAERERRHDVGEQAYVIKGQEDRKYLDGLGDCLALTMQLVVIRP